MYDPRNEARYFPRPLSDPLGAAGMSADFHSQWRDLAENAGYFPVTWTPLRTPLPLARARSLVPGRVAAGFDMTIFQGTIAKPEEGK